MQSFCLRVADHVFCIEAARDILAGFPNYAPFVCSAPVIDPLFVLRIGDSVLPPLEGWSHFHTDKSDADMPRIEMYRRGEEWMFRISMYRDSEIVTVLLCDAAMQHVALYGEPTRFAIDNATMLFYAFTSAACHTLLFHASVVMRDHKGYLFLGHSGTGKSTHSQQWLKAFPDAVLLNDDNPVVRVLEDGSVHVYGSPWSGKTPCYKNLEAPVAALVQLAQAPQNTIAPLRPARAYPYLLSSVSGMKMLPKEMDAIYDTLALLLEHKPVFLLSCLPDTAAAQLCFTAINSYPES